MKKSTILFLFLLWGCASYKTDLPTVPCATEYRSDNYSRAADLKKTIDEMIANEVPGAAIAVHSEEGWWHYAAGLAKIEDQTRMQSCHLHYLQSIAKLYTAVITMKLQEEGKLEVENPITKYMPDLEAYIERADEITIKMLLNHTSGIPEYITNPNYLTQLWQKPQKDWNPRQYLPFLKGKPLLFEPGSRYLYINTNYEILAMILDEVTGDHAEYMDQVIFEPLGITSTFYRSHDNYLKYEQLYNGYWDRYSNAVIENTSTMQRQNVSDMIGDDGIVSTPHDAVVFLKGLFDGKIISDESLEEMQEWVKNSTGENTYGLGFDLADFQGNKGMGHSGGGLGAGCQLYYFPEKKVFVFMGINLSTITYSPIHDDIKPLLNKIYDQLLN